MFYKIIDAMVRTEIRSCDKTEVNTWNSAMTLFELIMLPWPWFPYSKTGVNRIVVNHKNKISTNSSSTK